MSPIRNDDSSSSININNSERDKQELERSSNTNSKQNLAIKTERTSSKISDISTKTDEGNSDNNDCFIKYGFVSSSEEKNQRIDERIQNQKTSKIQTEENENEQDQPAYLVEEINAITALMIYDTYSKKHEFALSPQHRAKRSTPSNPIRDDIDRFAFLYSCLIDQSRSSEKSNFLRNYLRDRFNTLPNVNELKMFQQNEQSRVYEEKKAKLNRVPFIPNILSYQRTCPYYNLDEIKWIRDHLC